MSAGRGGLTVPLRLPASGTPSPPTRRDRVPDRLWGALKEPEEPRLEPRREGDHGLGAGLGVPGGGPRSDRPPVEEDAPSPSLGSTAGADQRIAGLLELGAARADAEGGHCPRVHLTGPRSASG